MAELKKVYHVLPKEGGGWLVKEAAAKAPTAKYDTKPEAVTRAKALGVKAKAKVVVHKKDGSVERDFPFVAPAPVKKPVVKAAAKPVAKPVAKKVVKPVAKKLAKPVAKKTVKPVAKKMAKPVAKPVAKPAAKKVVKPVAKKVVKPVAKKK
jgi:hypothetical protein